MVSESQKAHGFIARFDGARTVYKGAADTYMSALSSRRSQYADVGATADLSETGGKAPGQGKDASSQAMLYISAARETNLLVHTAIAAGADADKYLRVVSQGTYNRKARIYASDHELEQLEDTKGKKERDAAGDALGHVFKWNEFADNRKGSLEHAEEEAKASLAKLGVGGDY
jgi:hypothetical protein